MLQFITTFLFLAALEEAENDHMTADFALHSVGDAAEAAFYEREPFDAVAYLEAWQEEEARAWTFLQKLRAFMGPKKGFRMVW